MGKYEGYTLAKGRMAEVWAKLICPVCDGELEHLCDEYDDVMHEDSYTCDYCNLIITYVTPLEYHTYHEVPDHEHFYTMEGAMFNNRVIEKPVLDETPLRESPSDSV